jgi:hypothetical protein
VGKGARTGPQAKHQNWNKSNLALRMNIRTEKPVRVIRGYQGDQFWSPAEGFMYSGLYEVVACWTEKGYIPSEHVLTGRKIGFRCHTICIQEVT